MEETTVDVVETVIEEGAKVKSVPVIIGVVVGVSLVAGSVLAYKKIKQKRNTVNTEIEVVEDDSEESDQ